VEYSLRDVLNNFKECWWDHVIVDFLVCNMLGIVLGLYVIEKFKLEKYRWSFRDGPLKENGWEQFKYFCTHWDLSKLEVKSFAGLKKYLQLSWFIILVHRS
jgi:phosphatidylserine synthase 2